MEAKIKKPRKSETPPQDDIQFGVNWTKEAASRGLSSSHDIPEIRRRMMCARWNVGSVSRFDHRKHLIQTIWPENIYAWHYWTDRRLHGTCEHNFVTWMAGGGTGKTTDAAIMALEWWLEQPDHSAVVVCSTTKDMLRTRIWGQIVHYHSLIPKWMGPCGDLLDASCFIRWREGDWKNGLKGVAVQDGPVEEAVNNIIGMHTSRVLWVLDEMQGVREAIVKAIPNLLKNPESRFWGMGNPDSFMSLLGRYSEPVGGWDAIVKFQDEWETESHGYEGTGICQFFDGRKSPAVLDPVWGKRHPWMTNQGHIDAHLKSKEVNGNENHPAFMTQTIGWPPSSGIESTILDHAIITSFKCDKPALWTDGYTESASLDPAFNGGDKAILQFLRRGYVKDHEGARWVIEFRDWAVVPIDGESARPIHYQIVDFCKAACEKRRIPPKEFAIAAAGEGGGLKSIFDQEWGPVNGIEEGGSPSERVVDDKGKTAKEAYDTRASELCFGVRDFALSNGIRGLPQEAASQFCKRQTFYRNGKWCAEPKVGSKGRVDEKGRSVKGFKQRLGFSPDHADSVGIGLEHCRMMGAEPTMGAASPKKYDDWNRKAIESDRTNSAEVYTEETDWSRQFADIASI